MKTDFLVDNAFAHMDSRPILLLFTITLLVAYAIARRNKNHYEMNRILKSYSVYVMCTFFMNIFLGIKLALVLGIVLMGLIVLIFKSNSYFYGR